MFITACGGSGRFAPAASTVICTPVMVVTDVPVERVTKDHQNGAIITALIPNAGLAHIGSMFSGTLCIPSDTDAANDAHQTTQLQVTLNGMHWLDVMVLGDKNVLQDLCPVHYDFGECFYHFYHTREISH